MKISKLFVLFSLLLACTGARAQAGPPRAQEEELQEALRQHFQTRLRAELRLSDEQFTEVLPLVERLEDERRRVRRERAETVRQLRHAYEGGASDDELQALLDRLTEIDERSRSVERELQKEIDQVLTVRQRVHLRFFIKRFRQELRRRIQDIRRERHRVERRRRLLEEEPPPEDWP